MTLKSSSDGNSRPRGWPRSPWPPALSTSVAGVATMIVVIVGKDRVLFAIVQVGGFLGIGSHLIAVPCSPLQINEDGSRIVLPGATREQVKGLPEFKYR
jgi:hypothetical protein